MPEEERLIAELGDRDQERLAAQSALAQPQYYISMDEFQQLAKATQLARGKVAAVRVRLRSLRQAKGRRKDSYDLHKLQNALNELAEEIDTITYAGEAAKEQTSSPKAVAAHQERFRRLQTIREKLAELAHVMDSADGEPRSPSLANANSDIGEALQKLQSAESHLDDVETHLNNVEGAHVRDQDEIASAKDSTNNVDDALKAAKAALEKVCPQLS